MDLIRPYLLMGRQDPERLSPCLVLIGMITWATKTQWAVLEDPSTRNKLEVILSSRTNKSSVSSLEPLSIYSEVLLTWWQTEIKVILYTALFCKFTTKNCLICSRTKTAGSHWTLEKINIQASLLRVKVNTWSLQRRTASLCLREERQIESRGRLAPTFTLPGLTQSFKFLSRVILLMLLACYSGGNWISAIWLEVKRLPRMKLWTLSISMSSKLSIRVCHLSVRWSQLLLRARRKITFHTGTQRSPGFCRTHLVATQRPPWSPRVTRKAIAYLKQSPLLSSPTGPSKLWSRYLQIL